MKQPERDPPGKPGAKRATVIDVARLAGVSAGTVSNAINGKRRVDPETRSRVDAAISALGYRPNMAARGIRTGRANTIALFSSMATGVAAGPSRLGFLMEIAAAAALAALERNVALVLVPPIPEPEAALRTVPLDGALLVEPARNDPFLPFLAARGIPTVSIGAAYGMVSAQVDLNYEATADLLIDHLLEMGARDFPLLIGTSARRYFEVFEARYRARAAQIGMVPQVLRIEERLGEAAAAQVMARHLLSRPGLDGVLAPVDALATGAMMALREARRAVPAEVRVVTRYDGLRARSEAPQLTAVDLHLDMVARHAAIALLELIEGRPVASIVPGPLPQIIVRGSSRPG
ncbi:LacI family DNA-binding transcriptional regulator [Rhodobacter maris]|uniref:LacI family transcriptional regulator n=1 Tax=Rhodobacter maris TaxID=446682 RepID=A0A285RH93_9RHOB|nr:LacI family DNA-binding transcriptional regulator [Rhodobacter maris]SOB93505.1 LacI family transcriptional regulator [Rhodobacter maris]